MASGDSSSNTRAFLAMNGAGPCHPALDTGGKIYDRGRHAWVDSSLVNPSKSQAETRFFAALDELKRQCPLQTDSQFDIRSGHSWQDVLSIAGSALESKKDRSLKRFFSQLLDKGGDHMASIEKSFSGLAPSGDYTSVICGGFILILRAFARLPKLRKEALDTVGTVPELLQRTERLIALYSDQLLQDKVDQVYVALLYVLEEIIKWYPKVAKNLFTEIILPGLSFDKEGKIANLNRCAKELDQQSDLCDKERLYCLAIDAAMGRDWRNAQDMRQHDGAEQLDRIEIAIKALRSPQDDFLVKGNQFLDRWFERLLASTEEAFTRMRYPGIEDIRSIVYDRQAATNTTTAMPHGVEAMHSPEIIRQLGTNATDGPANAALALVKARRNSANSRLVSPLLSHPLFNLWLSSPASRLLFVLPGAAHPRDSETDYITASIYRALQQLPTAISTVHFCAQQSRDTTRDPVYELTAQIISQLLDSPLLANFSCTASFAEGCASGDLTLLSELLEYLLGPQALPQGSVYILIDGFESIERDDDSYDALKNLVVQFRRIVSGFSPGRSAMVKILILAPDFRGDIVRESDPDEVMRLTSDKNSGYDTDVGEACGRLLVGSSSDPDLN